MTLIPQIHLVVDDRRDVRFLSKRMLTDAGATVTEAEDGEIAVAAVVAAMERSASFDLILLDMQMPKLDGYATAKALRKLGFANPIVALTADHSARLVVKILLHSLDNDDSLYRLLRWSEICSYLGYQQVEEYQL